MMRQNDNITVMQKRDDQEMITLLLAFEEGDATAFSKLYDLNVNLLFSYGCKLTTDRELLKDCIHDVFVKMYTKKEELKHVENFKSYLFISLRNRLCDEVRKRLYVSGAKLLQKSEMRKDIVIELSYKGFG